MFERHKRLPRTGQNGGIASPQPGQNRVEWLKQLGILKWKRGIRPSSDCIVIGATQHGIGLLNPGDDTEGLTLFILKKDDWMPLLLAHRRSEQVPQTGHMVSLAQLILVVGFREMLSRFAQA
jgi:hypothetical protein